MLTDQSRDAVFLKGRVRCGPAFSKVMLVLGQIVKMAARATEKDHSAYQEWARELRDRAYVEMREPPQ